MAGLLMYFEPVDVKRLIAGIAERFPRAEMIFDIIPRWFSKKTLAGLKLTAHYTPPPMPFGMDRNELAGIKDWHQNIAEISEPAAPKARGFLFRYLAPIIERMPVIKNKIPTAAHVRCAPAGS
jgi:O-methyltransferase involved in polyketide biosynthesis